MLQVFLNLNVKSISYKVYQNKYFKINIKYTLKYPIFVFSIYNPTVFIEINDRLKIFNNKFIIKVKK